MRELIDKYFEGTLDANEQLLFENQLTENAEFKADYDFQVQVRRAIHVKERADLKAKLQRFEAKQTVSDLKIVRRSFWPFAAAAILLLVSSFGLYQYFNSSIDTQKLYAENFEAYPNVIAPTVRGENNATIESEAFKAYDANNFEAAASLFEKLEQKEYVQFYSAVCYLELEKAQKAVDMLENKTFENEPFPFETYRKWYLVLAYLKLENIEKAKVLLNELSKSENPQKLNALKLLNDL